MRYTFLFLVFIFGKSFCQDDKNFSVYGSLIDCKKDYSFFSKSDTLIPVSYTHLDVYKRQLHITMIGFQSLRVRVTNDWIKNGTAKLILTEKAIALEEVKIKRYNLTGYLEVDSKLIPEEENFRYSISGPVSYTHLDVYKRQ